MKLAAHQPQYLPWLGYFDKMDAADCFVVLDSVQFAKNDWQNRNRIKSVAGWQWLTVPVRHRFPQPISEAAIDNGSAWGRKHLQALVTNYSGAPFFEPHRPFFEKVYGREWTRLSELNQTILAYLADALGIRTKLVLASTLPEVGDATDRLVGICQALGAETYLSGAGARGYLDLARFAEAGIEVGFQTFRCRPYPQRFGAFEPDLSVVDLLFNCGDASLELLRQGRETGEHPGDRRPSG